MQDEFVFQYKNAPLWGDREESMDYFKDHMDDNTIYELVKSIANQDYNEVTIYDLVKQCETKECVTKVEEYGIKRLPAIAIDGKLMECCKNNSITKQIHTQTLEPMVRLELTTSPLPRVCSTPEPHGQLERETGLEPATLSLEG